MRWLTLFTAKLDEARASAEDTVLSGNGVSEHSRYQYLIGTLHGLRLAKEVAYEVEDELNKG